VKLYTYFRSSAAYRARIALGLKGLRYESCAKSLLSGEHLSSEYLSLNPQGLLPALEVDGVVLSQSLAIIEFLNERYPAPPLLPSDAIGRARVRSMALTVACDIHPLNNLRVLNYLRGELKLDDAGVKAWYRHWISEGFKGLEALVAAYSDAKRYCHGDSVSMADVCLVPQMYNARRFGVELAPYPTLVAVCEHLESLPAFAAARPEAQPDSR
jgi:maleylacetoacetate isomerase